MKKCFLFALAAIIFCGCQKDNFVESSEVTTGPSLLKLQISMDKLSTGRAIEDGHTTGLTPRIYSVTVFAYNEYGIATELDLSDAQIKEAISGNYFFKNDKDYTIGTATITDGKVTKGASIGLPVGTSKVDVVMNNPSNKYKDLSQNINYFNHQNRKSDDGGWPDATDDSGYFGNNNYDRVFLVTDDYGKGVALEEGKLVEKEYRISFTVKPALARFEVHGSINVAPETDWSDAFGCWWRRIAKDQLIDLAKNSDALKDIYDVSKKLKQGMCEETIESVVYLNIPEAYITGGNKEKNDNYNHGSSPVGNWTASDYYKLLTPDNQNTSRWTQVKWYPNTFYAIDVEEIYVNNIHVPSADPAVAPILTPWPGFDNLGEPKGWPHWYKAYHLHGWHTAGYSSTNGFYCMANMWNRIAQTDPSIVTKLDPLGSQAARGTEEKVNWEGFSVSDVNGNGELHTTYLTGGTLPIDKVSAYGDKNTSRNIGIIENKAAAYMIYDQVSKTSAGKEPDAYTDLPHIIVKVKCYKDKMSYIAGVPTSSKNFITMKLFSEDGTAAKYITKFERGTIYRVDLNNLVKSFVGEIPVKNLPEDDANKEPKPTDPVTPDPEMPGSHLTMGIKVLDWIVKNAMPII